MKKNMAKKEQPEEEEVIPNNETDD